VASLKAVHCLWPQLCVVRMSWVAWYPLLDIACWHSWRRNSLKRKQHPSYVIYPFHIPNTLHTLLRLWPWPVDFLQSGASRRHCTLHMRLTHVKSPSWLLQLHYHGKHDNMVTIEFARATQRFMQEHGVASYELVEENGLGHTLSRNAVIKFREFVIAHMK